MFPRRLSGTIALALLVLVPTFAPARAAERAPGPATRRALDRERRLPNRDRRTERTNRSRLPAHRPAASAAFDRTIDAEATLVGHGYHLAYAVTPDGQYLATVPYEARGSIRILRTGDGGTVRTFAAHDLEVTAIAVSPDGRFVLSAGRDVDPTSGIPYTAVKAWRLDGTAVMTFDGLYDSFMNTVAVSPDGAFVYAGDDNGALRAWNVSDGALVRTTNGHAGAVNVVAVSADGSRVVSGGADGAINIWMPASAGIGAKPARRTEPPAKPAKPARARRSVVAKPTVDPRVARPAIPADIARTAAELPLDGSVAGTIASSALFAAYSFSVPDERAIAIHVIPTTSGYDPILYLYDATGTIVLASNDDWGGTLESRIAGVFAAGSYIVAVRKFDTDLFLTRNFRLLAETIAGIGIGGTYEAEITDEMFERSYLLTLPNPGRVVVTLAQLDSTLDPFLAIYDASGALVADDDDGAGGHDSKIDATLAAGTYSVIATRYNTIDGISAGRFRLAVTEPPAATPIALGGSATGFISDATLDERYQFTLDAAGSVGISMTATSGDLDPYLTLLDGNGTEIASNDDWSGTDSRIEVDLAAGTYTIVAGRYDGQGAYLLSLEDLGASTLAPGRTAYGTIDDANWGRTYTLVLDLEQTLAFTMRATSGDLDPYLAIFDESSAVIDSSDDWSGLDARIVVTLQPGTYTVVATRAYFQSGTSAGDYTLAVEELAYGDALVKSIPTGYPVDHLALSPDGARILAAQNRETYADLWTLADGAWERALAGHDEGISSLTFSGDGDYAIVAEYDGSVRLWRTSDGALDRTMPKVHSYQIEWMAPGLGGDVLFTAAWGVVKILELPAGRMLQQIGFGTLMSGAFARDGRHVVTGSADGRLRLWDRRTGALLATSADRHDDWIVSCTFSADGQYVYTGGDIYDGTAKMWRASDLALVRTIPHGYGEKVSAVVPDPDGTRLFTTTTTGALRVLRTSDGAIVREWSAARSGVAGAAWIPSVPWRVVTVDDTSATVWDPETGALVASKLSPGGSIIGASASPDEQVVYIGTASGACTAWRWATNITVGTWQFDPIEAINAVAGGQYFVTAERITEGKTARRMLRVRSATDGTAAYELDSGHTEWTGVLSSDTGGRYLASLGDDQVGRSWVVSPPFGESVQPHLSVEAQPGLPVRITVRGTAHGVLSATLKLAIEPTVLVPAIDGFVVSHAFAGQTGANVAFAVNGSTVTVTLTGDRRISLADEPLLTLSFVLSPTAVPGAMVPLSLAAGTLVDGLAPVLTGGTFTVPVPRDTRISSVAPESVTGGVSTEIAVRGANLTGATAVDFVATANAAATPAGYELVNDALCRVFLPAGLATGGYLIRVVAPRGTATSAQIVTVLPPAADTQPPAPVSDLRVDSVRTTSMLVRWTAPADFGTGLRVRAYELRYTTAAIDSASFRTLPTVRLALPKAPGQTEAAWVAPLESGRIYFFALVSVDSAGNRSRLSNLAHGITVDDVQPPQVLRVAETAITDRGVTVLVETDEPATASLQVFAAFGGGDTIRAVEGTHRTLHRLTAEGLTPATFYGYTVRLADAKGNLRKTAPRVIQTLANPDLAAPRFSQAPFVGTRADHAVTIGWSANEPITAVVRYGLTTATSESLVVSAPNTNHIIDLAGLAPLTTYRARIAIFDMAGNGPATSDELVLRTLRDPESFPPQFTQVPAVVARDSSRVTLIWATDAPAAAVVEYGATEAYGQAVEALEYRTVHSVVIAGLAPDTRYHYRAIARDADQGETVTADGAFRTTASADRNPPVILESPVVTTGTDHARVRFRTDEPAMATLLLFDGASNDLLSVIPPGFEFGTDHDIYVGGLAPATAYRYHLVPYDLAHNQPILRVRSFTTAAERDTVRPVVVAGPDIVYAADDRVVIRWTTDEVTTGELWYRQEGDSVALSVVDPSFDWTHQATITGLPPGKNYAFAVVARDGAGNSRVVPEGTDVLGRIARGGKTAPSAGRGGTFSTSTSADAAPPVVLAGPTIVSRSNTTLTVQWETDEAATSVVWYSAESHAAGRPAANHRESKVEDGKFTRQHIVTLTNLRPATTYGFDVNSTDPVGNDGTSSTAGVSTTLPAVDLAPPRIVDGPAILASDRRAIVRWETDEIADSEVIFWTGDGPRASVAIGERTTSHTIVLTNLAPNTTYHCTVRSADLQDNGPTEVRDIAFITQSNADVEPPVVSGVRTAAMSDAACRIAWATSEPADSRVEFGETAAYGLSAESGDRVTDHGVWLTNLKPAKTYFYRVSSADIAGNGLAGADGSFTTAATEDVDPPPAPPAPAVVPGNRAAQVAWRRVAADDVAGYHIYRRRAAEADVLVATLVPDTLLLDTGLDNGASYTWRIRAIDAYGNESALSPYSISITPDAAATPGQPDVVSPSGSTRTSVRPRFTVTNAAPSPLRTGATLSYTFVVARDPQMTRVVFTSALVPGGTGGTTGWIPQADLEHDSTYFWSAAAYDGVVLGPLGAPGTFTADRTIPTAIALAAFTAAGDVGAIRIGWTGAEPSDRFRILRTSVTGGDTAIVAAALSGRTDYVFLDVVVVAGRRYAYRLVRTLASGETVVHGPVEAMALAPERFELVGAAPNPFNPSTVVTIAVPRAERVRITIHTITGQRVRTLVDGALVAGIHRLTWDGTDDAARRTGSGVYLVRMEAPGYRRTIRVALVR